MANSDKNIVITPNTGSASTPTIVFTGGSATPGTLTVNDAGTLSFDKQFISSVATGTAPFAVSSTTRVANLNVATAGTADTATTATTANALNTANSYTGVNFTATGSLIVGSGGLYQAGSIYSDGNWGMIFRAKQASPAIAEFMWANSVGTELFRYNGSALTTSITGNAATITSQANSATITATTTATASRIVLRDSNGDDFRRYGHAEYFNMSHGASGATTDTIFYSSTDNYIRKNNATGFRASLNVPTRTGGDASGTWGISITGNARGISVPDTRAVDDQPQNKIGNAITADFKSNTSVGNPPVNASALYSHIITVSGWSSGEGSGGWPTQLSVGTNGIAYRQATAATTWSAWNSLINTSTTQSNNLWIRNTSPTVFLRDTDSNTAFLHCNSNLFYILRGDTDATTWTQVSGQWPVYWNLTNNEQRSGGAIFAVGDVTAFSSDRRLKENIRPIENSLAKVLQLTGVNYDWKDTVDELGFIPPIRKNDAGLIAQDVEKVLPQAVAPAPFDQEWDNDAGISKSKSGENYLTVKYEKLVPLLIEAIKELDGKYQIIINELKNEINSLRNMLNGKQ